MKRHFFAAAAVTVLLVGCNEPATEQTTEKATDTFTLDEPTKRVSYGMGVGLGERIAQEGIDINTDAFALGLKHATEKSDRLMTQEEIAMEMEIFQKQQMEKQQAKMAEIQAEQAVKAKVNKQEGEDFLVVNAKKEGVITLESGLQYSVITEGSGSKPSANDTVEVHYRGKLIDGTEFDSSYKRESTVSFPVKGVIAGWTEALQLMNVGAKWNLYIPSDLAYGLGGTGGGPIGPNATLLFEVELVSIPSAENPTGEEAVPVAGS